MAALRNFGTVTCVSRQISYCARLRSLNFVRHCSSNVGPNTENAEEDEIMRIRNKAKLPPNIMAKMQGKPPPINRSRDMTLIRNLRKSYALYGSESGVDPGVMWPSKEAIRDKIEFEKEFYPTLQEMIQKLAETKKAEAEYHKEREETVRRNLEKLDKAKRDMFDRIAKKEGVAIEQRKKKEQLLEEVREFIGYDMNPNDPRFKEILEAKEKEQQQREKDAKKKEKKAKLLARIAQAASAVNVNKPAGTDPSKLKNNDAKIS